MRFLEQTPVPVDFRLTGLAGIAKGGRRANFHVKGAPPLPLELADTVVRDSLSSAAEGSQSPADPAPQEL